MITPAQMAVRKGQRGDTISRASIVISISMAKSNGSRTGPARKGLITKTSGSSLRELCRQQDKSQAGMRRPALPIFSESTDLPKKQYHLLSCILRLMKMSELQTGARAAGCSLSCSLSIQSGTGRSLRQVPMSPTAGPSPSSSLSRLSLRYLPLPFLGPCPLLYP